MFQWCATNQPIFSEWVGQIYLLKLVHFIEKWSNLTIITRISCITPSAEFHFYERVLIWKNILLTVSSAHGNMSKNCSKSKKKCSRTKSAPNRTNMLQKEQKMFTNENCSMCGLVRHIMVLYGLLLSFLVLMVFFGIFMVIYAKMLIWLDLVSSFLIDFRALMLRIRAIKSILSLGAWYYHF